jgi:dipeptidase E
MSYWRPVSDWLVEYLRENSVQRIAYIINADKRRYIEEPDLPMYDFEFLKQHGFDITAVDLDELDKTPEIFESVDLVYVRGGNTFDLLEAVQRSGFTEILGKLLSQGVIYAGSSAASTLVGPNIEIAENDFAPDYNLVGLSDTTGLGFTEFAIFPHWEEGWRGELNALIARKNIKYPIRCLKDKQVMVVKDGKEELINL